MEELNALSEDPKLWDTPEKAQKLMSEKTNLENALQTYQKMNQALKDNLEMAELYESDEDMSQAVLAELETLKKEAEHQKLEAMLSGEADHNDAYMEIHAGSGGTEAQEAASHRKTYSDCCLCHSCPACRCKTSEKKERGRDETSFHGDDGKSGDGEHQH